MVIEHDAVHLPKHQALCTAVIALYQFDANWVHIGVSRCSEGDQFNRKIGHAIALGRAKSNRPGIAWHGKLLPIYFNRLAEALTDLQNTHCANYPTALVELEMFCDQWEITYPRFGDFSPVRVNPVAIANPIMRTRVSPR